ncbi:MAG: ABC transporter permease [Rhizobiaceae bacterium]
MPLSHRLLKAFFYFWVALGFAYILIPLALIVWMSFFSNSIPYVPPAGYTVAWYAVAAGEAQFYASFLFSFQVAVIAAALGLVVSIPAALVLRNGKGWLSAAILNLLTAPLIVPTIVIGAGIYITLITIEIATQWPIVGSLWAFGLAHVLLTIPWCIRLLLANLQTVNSSLEEAAASLGARPAVVLYRVTLPVMWSGVVAAALFSFVVSFGNIELSVFLSQPGNTTLPVVILQYLTWKLDPSVAAVSVVQIALIAAMLLIADRYINLTRVV